jgi:hypothetical protein
VVRRHHDGQTVFGLTGKFRVTGKLNTLARVTPVDPKGPTGKQVLFINSDQNSDNGRACRGLSIMSLSLDRRRGPPPAAVTGSHGHRDGCQWTRTGVTSPGPASWTEHWHLKLSPHRTNVPFLSKDSY